MSCPSSEQGQAGGGGGASKGWALSGAQKAKQFPEKGCGPVRPGTGGDGVTCGKRLPRARSSPRPGGRSFWAAAGTGGE